MTTPTTTSAALRDDDPLMEAIALAVWEQCERQDYRTTNDDPRNIAAVAATVARALLLPDTTADDPGPEPEPWPTPEEAYADAPHPRDEFDWLISQADAGKRNREWWLRRAAAVDRRSANLPPDHRLRDEHALELAHFLIELDGATVTGDPRRYVRRQYLYWARNN
ncbi:hypothetical protein [Streptomyces sp. SID12501]|uniref:Uncharacterized protein n=1 Tax=Streptomyces sp. SID12501 TaxID=2706042 RepID=A0A6B3BU35_9ACTN|nr:hypothetical protein [Streptomyces sp. SID12501]NEC87885.1 hypothetical protein [Streptomyces sp. SID12501]